MKINKKKINKYYCKRSACQVLGCMMKNPRLATSREYTVNENDFVSPLHKTLFMVIYNLSIQGASEIKLGDVETYLANNDVVAHNRVFENGDGAEWIVSILEDANESNYAYYHSMVRKYSYLRCKMEMGQDVSEILDLEEINTTLLEQQRESFERMTLNDIIKYFDSLNLQSKNSFMVRSTESSRKVGENARELREQMKLSPDFGYTYTSRYLNTVSRGARKGTFTIRTQDTGTGKSRDAVEMMLVSTVVARWDFETQAFISNPFYDPNDSSLYIGTELDLYREVEVMAWAFVSGVPEYKIKENITTKEEDERIDKAIEILEKSNFYMEDEPNYDLNFLWNIIEKYKIEHNIGIVTIDYLEGTSGILSEYASSTKGMAKREDQALLNMSKEIKEMARRFDVAIIGYTQTNNEARRDYTIRDAGAIKGSTSLANKADLGITVFPPVKKEIELVQPLIDKVRVGMVRTDCVPNMVMTIYKNRGGRYKDVKIWFYVDLGTMEFIDLFVTNLNYEPINIDKTEIHMITQADPNVVFNEETGEVVEIGEHEVKLEYTQDNGMNIHTVDNSDMEDLFGKQIGGRKHVGF